MSQNMANPSKFLLPNRVKYLPVFIYSPKNFLISNLVISDGQSNMREDLVSSRRLKLPLEIKQNNVTEVANAVKMPYRCVFQSPTYQS